MQEYFIETKGIKTRVVEWGNKDKPVVLCLHGLGSTALSFIELADILKDDYRFIAIDLPGHGKTLPFKDSADFTMPKLAHFVDSVCKILEISQFYLLSHSWGAQISMYFFSEFGSNVKKGLLLDGGYHIHREIFEYNKRNNLPIISQEEDIECYRNDFENYIIDELHDFFADEKKNYPRWSKLLDTATQDLAIFKNNKYCWHATGDTVEFCLVASYNYPPNLTYQNLRNSNTGNKILLLQSTIPESMTNIFNIFAEKFQTETGATGKKMPLGHMMHWENPEMVVEEIREWFK